MKSGKVLVLGATGFIGKEVLKALIGQIGKENIAVLSHKKTLEERGIETYRGGIENMDWSLLDENPPTQIIHLARINSRRFGSLGRFWAAYKGRKANLRLIRHMKDKGWNTVVTYVSGSLMYGDNANDPVFEDAPLDPVSFARQYYQAEEPWLNCGVPVNMVRVPWVFGAGSWFAAFYLKPMKEKREVSCYGSGNNMMSFIDVEDAGRMIAWTALHQQGGTYHLAMPDSYSQLEFVQELAAAGGCSFISLSDEYLARNYEKAVYEAFSSSINLQTRHKDLFPVELMQFKDLRSLLSARLPLFLKNK